LIFQYVKERVGYEQQPEHPFRSTKIPASSAGTEMRICSKFWKRFGILPICSFIINSELDKIPKGFITKSLKLLTNLSYLKDDEKKKI
jgi:hypothetical protein